MNFLGHLLLSHGDADVMLGNFLGDFVVRRDYGVYSQQVRRGFELHLHIDSFTDRHSVVARSKSIFSEDFGRYSSVIVDVVYDHFIAIDWALYHTQELDDFADTVYERLLMREDVLPDSVQRFLPYMVRDNWLVNYGTMEGLYRSLYGLSRRAQYNKELHTAVKHVEKSYSLLRNDVQEFIPEAMESTRAYLDAFASD